MSPSWATGRDHSKVLMTRQQPGLRPSLPLMCIKVSLRAETRGRDQSAEREREREKERGEGVGGERERKREGERERVRVRERAS